jgi:hypothetical protein
MYYLLVFKTQLILGLQFHLFPRYIHNSSYSRKPKMGTTQNVKKKKKKINSALMHSSTISKELNMFFLSKKKLLTLNFNKCSNSVEKRRSKHVAKN